MQKNKYINTLLIEIFLKNLDLKNNTAYRYTDLLCFIVNSSGYAVYNFVIFYVAHRIRKCCRSVHWLKKDLCAQKKTKQKPFSSSGCRQLSSL